MQPIASGTALDPARVVHSLATDPLRTIENLLDTNRDRKIEATELRQAVQTGVSAIFLVADTNQDNQLSIYEAQRGDRASHQIGSSDCISGC